MVEVELRRHQLVEDGQRLAVDHRAALLDHHLPLGRHLRVDQLQVAHAVGFHDHRRLQVLLRQPLEVVGGIVRGHRIVAPAQARHHVRQLAGLELARGLEHQVLEEVGEPGLARDVVGAADAVPHHVRDDGRAAIGHDHHLHAVGEHELARAALGGMTGRESAELPRSPRRPQLPATCQRPCRRPGATLRRPRHRQTSFRPGLDGPLTGCSGAFGVLRTGAVALGCEDQTGLTGGSDETRPSDHS